MHSSRRGRPGRRLDGSQRPRGGRCCAASGGILPLANFGTVNFTNATANGSPIGNFSPTQIIMVDNSGRQKDSVSSLTGGGTFSATWLRAT